MTFLIEISQLLVIIMELKFDTFCLWMPFYCFKFLKKMPYEWVKNRFYFIWAAIHKMTLLPVYIDSNKAHQTKFGNKIIVHKEVTKK